MKAIVTVVKEFDIDTTDLSFLEEQSLRKRIETAQTEDDLVGIVANTRNVGIEDETSKYISNIKFEKESLQDVV